MKKCPNCSSVYTDDMMIKCANCGADLVSVNPEQQYNTVPPTNNYANYNQYNNQPYKYCIRCGNQCDARAVVCVRCGTKFNEYHMPKDEDKPQGILKLLCFFLPLLGLILYLVNMDSKPISAKAYGKMSIIGLIVGAVLYGLLMICILFVFPFVFSYAAVPSYEFEHHDEFYYSIIQGLTALLR